MIHAKVQNFGALLHQNVHEITLKGMLPIKLHLLLFWKHVL